MLQGCTVLWPFVPSLSLQPLALFLATVPSGYFLGSLPEHICKRSPHVVPSQAPVPCGLKSAESLGHDISPAPALDRCPWSSLTGESALAPLACHAALLVLWGTKQLLQKRGSFSHPVFPEHLPASRHLLVLQVQVPSQYGLFPQAPGLRGSCKLTQVCGLLWPGPIGWVGADFFELSSGHDLVHLISRPLLFWARQPHIVPNRSPSLVLDKSPA